MQALAYLSYNNNDQSLLQRSHEILKNFFRGNDYALSETEGRVLFIASGGSEQHAIERTKSHQHICLLCHRESNSFAAAMEIAAFLRAQNKGVTLIDVLAADAYAQFTQGLKISEAINELAQQKAALVGEVSDWLIISDVEKKRVKEKLGLELVQLPWSELDDYRQKPASEAFLAQFPKVKPNLLTQTAKVYTLLEEVIDQHQLSAISVECFSMVMRDKVTACLPLAVLNAQNKVAACEGDICSMLGKMVLRALCKSIPWQANIAEIKDDTVLFAHCTAPLNSLVSFDITTHFETNCGTAVRGKFAPQQMGVFRLNNQLDKYTLIEGEISNTPDYDFACRTQIELKTGKEQAQFLKEKSLGNHQLLFPAQYSNELRQMMRVLEIEEVIGRREK